MGVERTLQFCRRRKLCPFLSLQLIPFRTRRCDDNQRRNQRQQGRGDQKPVDTGGGDYAEGNIDKRQGVVITGSAQGTVVGFNEGTINIVQQAAALTPALHQLRAPVNDFVGREREIDQLVQALSRTSGAATTISGVRGMGGIGKTELAYVVAHRLKDSFPDAQLVLEPRGASSSPLTPEQALKNVIHSFEREVKLPDDLSQLKALYNSVLAGKRVLILADDAQDAGQVRMLMPPQGCALLVTSRNRFSLPGMQTIDLEVLSLTDVKKLLLEVCPRIGEHARKLAKLCGYLPLALRVSAGLLKKNDSRDVGRYLDQLRVQRLKHLTDPDNPDDPHASVEASLQLSFDALEPAAQSALCQMSVFPGSFSLEGARAVVVVEGDVDEMLELLRRRNLVDWDTRVERYDLHDLVREFGTAHLVDDEKVLRRHARYYAKVAYRAVRTHRQEVRFPRRVFETSTDEDRSQMITADSLLFGKSQASMLYERELLHIHAGQNWAQQHAGSPNDDVLIVIYGLATVEFLRGSLGITRVMPEMHEMTPLEAAVAAAKRLGLKKEEGIISDLLLRRLSFPHALKYLRRLRTPVRRIGSQQWKWKVFEN